MSILIKGMKMPDECHGCRWFFFEGTSCTHPRYYLNARCELVESGQDWYGKDRRGGWVGESITHIPGWSGNYNHYHCVEFGTRADQCPLVELPEKHGRLIEEPTSFSYGGLAYISPLDFRAIAEYFVKQVKAQPTVIEAEGDE